MSEEVGQSWDGAGPHEGHLITVIELWPTMIKNATITFPNGLINIADGTITCGRVRCTCGDEWDIGGFPARDHAPEDSR